MIELESSFSEAAFLFFMEFLALFMQLLPKETIFTYRINEMNMLRLTLLFMLATALMANKCSSEDVTQGIAGQVLWIEGNQMPIVIDEENPQAARQRPEPKGVEREIHIYELTTMGDAKGNGVFFSNIQTKLVEKVKTDEEGKFAVALPTGKYSVFVKEEEGLFANNMDGQGHINPVEVNTDSITPITLEVNYKAAY